MKPKAALTFVTVVLCAVVNVNGDPGGFHSTAIGRSNSSTQGLLSPRCASAIQIVRPSESTADTQPQLHSALLRLSAIDIPVFHAQSLDLFKKLLQLL